MKELRLLPAALLTWLVVLSTVVTRAPWVAAILLSVASAAGLKFRGEAITAVSLGIAGLVTSWLRIRQTPSQLGSQFQAVIASAPTRTTTGSWMCELQVGSGSVRAFSQEAPPPMGSTVLISGSAKPNDHPEVSPITVKIRALEVLQPPRGFDAWAGGIKSEFVHRCAQVLGPKTEGLVPGIVLGDTSGQGATEKQMYLDTGLSHLSAVSGSNITILTVSAVLLTKAATLGPRYQVAAAALTLAVFAGVVGFEPSVLRASVMGVVGLLAVLGSAQMEPAHGLCLAVIALLLYDSNLATSFGFALSVAATAGLVALSPLIYRSIAGLPGPDILKRALAVAIAADLVTMPLVAAMSGKVLLASVPANVLAAPAVAPVTVLGLIAVILPRPLDILALKLAGPFAWWIATVARTLADAPSLAIPVTWALLVAGWLLWLIHVKKAHWLLLGLLLCIPRPGPPAAELHNVVHLEELPADFEAPPGVQVVVVDKPGKPSARPHRTKAGVPILYPNRDGPVKVLRDGTQRAERGHF